MLKHLNAAMVRLWEARSLDHLADVAEMLLDAAVVIVVTAPVHAVLGTGARARAAPSGALESLLPLAGAAGTPPAPASTSRSAADDDDHRKPAGLGARGLEAAVGDRASDDQPRHATDGAETVAVDETGDPPPFARMATVTLRNETWTGAFLVFPSAGSAVHAGPLRAVAKVAEAAFADFAQAAGCRDHIVRLIAMLDTIYRAAHVGIWDWEVATDTLFWSDEVFRIHGMVPGQTPSRADALAVYPEPGRSRLVEALQTLDSTGRPTDLVLPFITAAGERRMMRVMAMLWTGTDGGERLAGVCQDVTTQEQIADDLWWTANHDVLTGLPNRALFADRFRKALQRRERTGGEVALVLVDIDEFKVVNDTFGHAAGDELLRLVAARLRAAVRAEDTVARTGGDEFSVLIDDDCRTTDLPALLAQLPEATSVRLVWGERTRIVTLSAGAAIAPHHAQADRDLTAAADVALYRAKEVPEGALVVFQPDFGQALREHSRLLADVRLALDEGHIVPWYQPQIDVVSGRIIGVEALARWIADDGVRSAADFMSAISDHDIGARIGVAVADRAIAEIAALNAPRACKIALAVNASAGELVQARFLERIGKAARSVAGGGGPITVEISENVVLDDPDLRLSERLEAASAAGVRFSLDDVGAGNSAFLSVSALPISEVKIARRFVSGLGADEARQKVVRGIIDAARALDLRVIVEGVETEAEVADIVALGGRYLQGYYYSRAVPLAELHMLLMAENSRLDVVAA